MAEKYSSFTSGEHADSTCSLCLPVIVIGLKETADVLESMSYMTRMQLLCIAVVHALVSPQVALTKG